MELRISRAEFLKGLRSAHSIADRKSTMPMLANVLVRISGKDKLLIAATDLNVSVSAELGSKNTGEGGLALGAKALHDIVSNMPGEEVTLKRADNNWAEIKAGKVSYRLVGMSDRDFPKIPDHREASFCEVDAGVLREMVDRTLFSVCNDETRFHLNGVLFESDGSSARMVSTDGHRLSRCDRPLPGAPKLSTGVIIPKKGVIELKRVLDAGESCSIAVKAPYFFVSAGGLHLAVKLIESDFPPYEAVIPKNHQKRMVVDRLLLLDALKRAQLMSSETRGVKLALGKGTLLLSSDNPDLGEVREELDVEYDGDDLAIGFNAKYMVEFLAHMTSDQVAFELNGELDPGLLRPISGDEYVGVVMPMRI